MSYENRSDVSSEAENNLNYDQIACIAGWAILVGVGAGVGVSVSLAPTPFLPIGAKVLAGVFSVFLGASIAVVSGIVAVRAAECIQKKCREKYGISDGSSPSFPYSRIATQPTSSSPLSPSSQGEYDSDSTAICCYGLQP